MSHQTLTIWQARVGEGWRYCTAETAAMICLSDRVGDRGRVRLAAVPEPRRIHRAKGIRYEAREFSPRRIAAAKKALQREQDAVPLFAHLVAASQPSVIGRLQQFEENGEAFWRDMRKRWADNWRQARAMLRQLSPEKRSAALFGWAVSGCPGTGSYLIGFLRGFMQEQSL